MISPAAEAPPNSGSISPGRPTRGPACSASHSRCAVTPSGTLRAPRRSACAPSLQDRVTLRQVNRLMRCGRGLRAAAGAGADGATTPGPRTRATPAARREYGTECTGPQGKRPEPAGASRSPVPGARRTGRSFLSVLRPLRRVPRPRAAREGPAPDCAGPTTRPPAPRCRPLDGLALRAAGPRRRPRYGADSVRWVDAWVSRAAGAKHGRAEPSPPRLGPPEPCPPGTVRRHVGATLSWRRRPRCSPPGRVRGPGALTSRRARGRSAPG